MTRPFCPVCAKKYMRQLWQGSCICTGHVMLPSTVFMTLPVVIRTKNDRCAMEHKHAKAETEYLEELNPRRRRRK